MYDITRIALNRAWRTGFGTIVHREHGPTAEHFPETPRASQTGGGITRLLPFAGRTRKS